MLRNPLGIKRCGVEKKIFLFSLTGLTFFVFIGFIGNKDNGYLNRFSQDELVLLKQIDEYNYNFVRERFNSLKFAAWDNKKRKVFLVGDAMHKI